MANTGCRMKPWTDDNILVASEPVDVGLSYSWYICSERVLRVKIVGVSKDWDSRLRMDIGE